MLAEVAVLVDVGTAAVWDQSGILRENYLVGTHLKMLLLHRLSPRVSVVMRRTCCAAVALALGYATSSRSERLLGLNTASTLAAVLDPTRVL